jgi:predicted ATPase
VARREQFLRAKGVEEWPDRTVAARYGFIHALYQEVLYERVTAGQRVGLHRRIGEREEQAYGDRAREIAAELAMHFEQGKSYRRAVRYHQLAGENALRRAAHVEAIAHLRKGLELLTTLPDTPERSQQELALQTTLGAVLIGAKGYAAPETGETYARARKLCQQVGEMGKLFLVLHGLWAFYIVRSELKTAHELAEQMLDLAERQQDRACLLEAHWALGGSFFCFGDLAAARIHLEQSIAMYDPLEHHHARP